jgi:hypothetical protein
VQSCPLLKKAGLLSPEFASGEAASAYRSRPMRRSSPAPIHRGKALCSNVTLVLQATSIIMYI